MTPGCRAAPGVFLCACKCCERWASENFPDCFVWRDWHARALWLARRGADPYGWDFSLRHATHQSHRMLSAWIDRPVHTESYGHFSGYPYGDSRGIFRRIHDIFQLRMGDRENAGRRRMAACFYIYWCECDCGIVAFDRGNSLG